MALCWAGGASACPREEYLLAILFRPTAEDGRNVLAVCAQSVVFLSMSSMPQVCVCVPLSVGKALLGGGSDGLPYAFEESGLASSMWNL